MIPGASLRLMHRDAQSRQVQQHKSGQLDGAKTRHRDRTLVCSQADKGWRLTELGEPMLG